MGGRGGLPPGRRTPSPAPLGRRVPSPALSRRPPLLPRQSHPTAACSGGTLEQGADAKWGAEKEWKRIVGMLTAITFSVWGRKANPSGGTWSTQAGCRAWFDWVTTVGASIGLGAFSILNASRCII
jgi:hypothetical protein